MDYFELKYDLSAVYGEEDYEFFSRFLLVTKGKNLPDIYLHYRLHPNSISHRKAAAREQSVINLSSKAVASHLPGAPVSPAEVRDLQNALNGTSSNAKSQRAKLMPTYFKIWDEFHRLHRGEPGILKLEQDVFAWAARMTLYPLFQPGILKALFWLTVRDWKWLFYLLKNIPYYRARRRIN
jgi:hypothetical protein